MATLSNEQITAFQNEIDSLKAELNKKNDMLDRIKKGVESRYEAIKKI